MFNLKLYNYDEEFMSIDEMMIEKNFVKEIMFPQPNAEQLEDILIALADYEGYLYQLYANGEFFSSGVVSADAIADDLTPLVTYNVDENENEEENNANENEEESNANENEVPEEESAVLSMPKIDEPGPLKGKIL